MNSKDLIYYEQSGGGIKSLGYNFKNILLEKGLPVSYTGGDKNKKNFYKNLNNYCVPTALVLLNKRVEDIHKNPTIYDLYDNLANSTTTKGSYEYDDLYSTLLDLSGFRKSKTRKRKKKSNKNTRKNNNN